MSPCTRLLYGLYRLLLCCCCCCCLFPTTAASSEASNQGTCLPHTLHIPTTVVHRSPHLVISHRGASYHLPEHSLPAYRLGLELGADLIEPDIVASQDGVLIALHTSDLNVTTNVVEKFGHLKEPWFSPTAGRAGYWAFNFTAQEIASLRVQQRLPAARTTALDGLFGVPRLEDILQVLVDWNTNDLPLTLPDSDENTTEEEEDTPNDDDRIQRKPTFLELHRAGLYLEFKDANWLKQEAGLDLVQLLFDHMQQHRNLWKPVMEKCYTVPERFDQYVVPGLIVQSFDIEALNDFSQQWPKHFSNQWNDPDNLLPLAPKPPSVLLVDLHTCKDPEFWYHVGKTWRSFVDGVGCEKDCLLLEEPEAYSGREFREKAAEFKIALHPWTERPEQTDLFGNKNKKNNKMTFPTVLQETLHLFCVLGVEGVFSESVSTAVLAAQLGCNRTSTTNAAPDPLNDSTTATTPVVDDKHTPQGIDSLCYESEKEAGVYTNLASFIMGLFVASLASIWVHRKQQQRRRQRQYHLNGNVAVPTVNPDEHMEEEEDDLHGVPTDAELEMT